jgi:hypothetical protein
MLIGPGILLLGVKKALLQLLRNDSKPDRLDKNGSKQNSAEILMNRANANQTLIFIKKAS